MTLYIFISEMFVTWDYTILLTM